MQTLAFHPLADIFPLLEGEDFKRLVSDIDQHGQAEPIIIHDGLILDGRNRYRACQELGVEPVTRDYDGDDPLAFVVSLNLHRRHLNESQRSMIAAKLANLNPGRPTLEKPANLPGFQQTQSSPPSQPEAARLLNVSERSVRAAREVQRDAVPEVRQAVEAGRVAVSAAAQIARLPQAEQQTVAAAGEKAIADKAREMREAKKAEASKVAAPEAANNVIALGSKLNVVPKPEAIERDLLADEAADELRRAEDYDASRVDHRARAINGALSKFDFVKLSGREYWSVYGKSPDRETFIKWVMAAKATIDDILKEYNNAEPRTGKDGHPAKGRAQKTGR